MLSVAHTPEELAQANHLDLKAKQPGGHCGCVANGNGIANSNGTTEDAEKKKDGPMPGSNGSHTSGGGSGGGGGGGGRSGGRVRMWFEEEIEQDLRWTFGVTDILHTGVSEFQDVELLESGPFGKVLVLDGKLQSAEADEFVYHESLVHPALLHHPCPKRVFIMGGGEGSTAREILKHTTVTNLDMCDIDQVVVDFCKKHLTVNAATFSSDRLNLIINDAREELRRGLGGAGEGYDVIVGDLADPVDGGPCYQLYTEEFYLQVLKPRLNPGGILVTQAGPAGILSATEVYTPIYNTLRQVFKYVVPYAAHVPSYADTWGWIMASDTPFPEITATSVDKRIDERVDGELRFLDGSTMVAELSLNKHVRRLLEKETTVYTEDSPLFIHGQGTQTPHIKPAEN